jgi:putative ABC transport system permease protein
VIRWLVTQSVRHAPRRLVLGALGIAFPVAMLSATLLFLNIALESMTRVALKPVQVEQRALATSLNVDMNGVNRKLAKVPGVQSVDRFAAADIVARLPGSGIGVSARVFAVDPAYLKDHPWVRVAQGSFRRGALLDQSVHDSPGFNTAKRISIDLPGASTGGPPLLSIPVSGTVDVRQALTTWYAIPAGDVQGDIAVVPRAIVIPYSVFERKLLPALVAKLGPTTPVLNPGLTDLPPVSLESHIDVAHSTYPTDPGQAAHWSDTLRRTLELQAPSKIVMTDNAFEPLTEAQADATNAKILFLLLGIPGAIVAAALGLAAQSALAEAHRREDALLRLRGATERQLVQLAAAEATLAWVLGSVVGLFVAGAAVTIVAGKAPWQGVSTGSIVLAICLAVAVGALTTAVRVVRLVRASRRSEEIAERRVLERGWSPGWLRGRLDLVAIGVGMGILAINVLAGGLKSTPASSSGPLTFSPATGSSVALSFYVLLAPIALWIGVSLFAVRILLARSARWTQPERSASLPSWRAAALRWLGRRPARTGVALILGTLAVAFGIQVITFVATYRTAKAADAIAAFGSDLRLTPGDPNFKVPNLGPDVASVSPIHLVPARAGSDRKTVLGIDLRTYSKTATSQPQIISGSGIQGLAKDPNGVLLSEEIAKDFQAKPGDPFPVTVLPDDPDKSRNLNLHVVGVYRSFPPTNPVTEMVMAESAFPPYVIPPPDFYMAKTTSGRSPPAVKAELVKAGLGKSFGVNTVGDQTHWGPRSITALNLGPLNHIESTGAALIAAIGVAVLGAFLVLERRREFAILRAVGAETRQILTGPAIEGIIAVLGSIAIGVPLGLGLGLLSVRILGLFFTLPPPLLTVPVGTVVGFVALMIVTSAIALALALVAVNRTSAAKELREP